MQASAEVRWKSLAEGRKGLVIWFLKIELCSINTLLSKCRIYFTVSKLSNISFPFNFPQCECPSNTQLHSLPMHSANSAARSLRVVCMGCVVLCCVVCMLCLVCIWASVWMCVCRWGSMCMNVCVCRWVLVQILSIFIWFGNSSKRKQDILFLKWGWGSAIFVLVFDFYLWKHYPSAGLANLFAPPPDMLFSGSLKLVKWEAIIGACLVGSNRFSLFESSNQNVPNWQQPHLELQKRKKRKKKKKHKGGKQWITSQTFFIFTNAVFSFLFNTGMLYGAAATALDSGVHFWWTNVWVLNVHARRS